MTVDTPGDEPFEIGYPELITGLIASMYYPQTIEMIGWLVPALLDLSDPTGYPRDRTESEQIVLQWLELMMATTEPGGDPDEYLNIPDAMATVLCTDGRHPADAGSWPAYAAEADRRAPHFGSAWAWWTAPCAPAPRWSHPGDRYKA